MPPTTLEQATAVGLGDLMKLGPTISLLVLIVIALCWFVKSLLQDAREERKLNRDALVNSTTVISELKELIRSALHN